MAAACLHVRPVHSCLLLIKCDGLHIITGTLASTLPGATTGGPLARRPAVVYCAGLWGWSCSHPLKRKHPKTIQYNVFFYYLLYFLRGAQNISVAFPPCIKAAACFAITWLFKCKAPLNPCGSSSTNRVRRDVRIFAFSSLPVYQIPTFWPQSGGRANWYGGGSRRRRRRFWRTPCVAIPATRLKMFSGRRIWAPWRTQQLLTGGILHHSVPSDLALTYLLLSLSPQFLFALRHLFVPCLLIWSTRCAAPSAFDIHPVHPPFRPPKKKKKKSSKMRCKVLPQVLWWDVKQCQSYGVIFSTCKSQRSLCPLGIVQGRRRQTRRKYPINLQDISCEAPFRTGDDVTLGASMSKCHDKLLHIIPCFYLMIALCVWVVPFYPDGD